MGLNYDFHRTINAKNLRKNSFSSSDVASMFRPNPLLVPPQAGPLIPHFVRSTLCIFPIVNLVVVLKRRSQLLKVLDILRCKAFSYDLYLTRLLM